MQSRADQNIRARAVVDDGDGVSAAPSRFLDFLGVAWSGFPCRRVLRMCGPRMSINLFLRTDAAPGAAWPGADVHKAFVNCMGEALEEKSDERLRNNDDDDDDGDDDDDDDDDDNKLHESFDLQKSNV